MAMIGHVAASTAPARATKGATALHVAAICAINAAPRAYIFPMTIVPMTTPSVTIIGSRLSSIKSDMAYSAGSK